MTQENDNESRDLDDFREYLMTIARLQLEPQLRDKLDASDVVQQTLLEAHQQRRQLRGQTKAELAGWLKQILVHNLMDVIRAFRGQKRDIARERALDASLNRSSARLEAVLAADQSTPSQTLQCGEQSLQLADALAKLPDAQREALVLQHWHGWSVAQIAEHMGRGRTAIAGLLKRGLQNLRGELGPQETLDTDSH